MTRSAGRDSLSDWLLQTEEGNNRHGAVEWVGKGLGCESRACLSFEGEGRAGVSPAKVFLQGDMALAPNLTFERGMNCIKKPSSAIPKPIYAIFLSEIAELH
jgi:hypothetical protein